MLETYRNLLSLGSYSATFAVKELSSPKEDISKGELCHLMTLEKNETYGIKDFDLKEICENMQESESEWGYDARNDKEVLLTHNKNLSQKEDQDNKSLINFPQSVSVRSNTYEYFTHDKPFIRNLLTMKDNIIIAGHNIKCLDSRTGARLQAQVAELQRFTTEEKMYGGTQLEKSVSNGSSVSSLHQIPPSVETTVLSAQHRKTHTREKSYNCNDCGKAFSKKSNLTNHKRIHSGQKPYRCSDCGKAFNHQSHLIAHQRVHAEEKAYKCGVCGKVFSRNSHLANHQRMHTGEKPYKCNECGKAFTQFSHLSRHQKMHAGEKPHKCNECGKHFTQRSNLMAHQRIHTGEKPFKCNKCDKAFIERSQLWGHERTHTGEKLYKCDECGKALTRHSYLTQHKTIHTGEKPYKCNECGKAYTQFASLTRHLKIHTENKHMPHTYGNAFIQSSKLKQFRQNFCMYSSLTQLMGLYQGGKTHTDAQQTHEKMLSIINHQGNAKHKVNEIPHYS